MLINEFLYLRFKLFVCYIIIVTSGYIYTQFQKELSITFICIYLLFICISNKINRRKSEF